MMSVWHKIRIEEEEKNKKKNKENEEKGCVSV